ncbi:RagB/SusD family nutrient uptake outer membrane protein [Sphingobacterium yanglingense]|uniref:SusD-like starch-binding protein associating with outer membrane n=1 Tax=Sphingobacterium yanglingense TaxID=1437280 RepID=A0A4R6W5Q1_9SPHI|nr:RagB/SusD family nutrient uptake outer membrane protein [Sphingobacterium yanglingense]TDQ72262.1 SusD-like starch-binding protein associating with outer membrane [Sphingobacterium yanglingense]
MKNLIYTLLIASLLYTSCDKYLDVEPRSQIELDKLYKEEKGFQDALSGIYILMKHEDSYGARMTQTTVENLISNWDVTAGTVEQKLGLFSYTDADVDKALSAIFSKQYATIASVNALLNNIDERKSVFKTEGLYNLIKGEALAIRAYVHLDILRLFGPIPTSPAEGSRLAYVTQFSKAINAHVEFEEYKKMLLKDIEEATALLKEVDPILHYSVSELREPNRVGGGGYRAENDFFAYRTLRMNYYAVRALEARAQLWFGNKEQAYIASKEVIGAVNNNNSPKFRLGSSSDMNAGDYVLREEHIFGLYDRAMFDWFGMRYSNGVLKKGTTVTLIKNTLFGNTNTDIREQSLWILNTLSNGAKAHVIRKYEAKDPKTVSMNTDYKQIPMLRMSEMYLIAAETTSFTEGITLLKEFRDTRSLKLTNPSNDLELKREIIKEYRKEFYAEGQGFFNYKRNNVAKADFLFIPNAATINYVLPLPKVEPVK